MLPEVRLDRPIIGIARNAGRRELHHPVEGQLAHFIARAYVELGNLFARLPVSPQAEIETSKETSAPEDTRRKSQDQ